MPGRSFEKFELIKRVLAHGRFVLHGSNDDNLRWIEPRSAAGYGQGRHCPAVYATEDVAIAVFHAVLDRSCVRWFTANPGQYVIETLEGATALWVPGAVYVLDRDDFDVVDGNLASSASVRAVGKVAVSVEDFPLRDAVKYQTRAAWLAARLGASR